jgi:23S rRNA (guanosine2251-2'-O)-methyltransferase
LVRRHHPARPNLGKREDLVFGIEPIRELVAVAPTMVRTLYLRAATRARLAAEVVAVAAAGGEIREVEDRALVAMAGEQALHQGVVARIEMPQPLALEDIIANRPEPILMVDGVSDPRNLGALLRSAEGAGVGAVVIARDRTARLTPAAIKSSAGAWVHLKIAQCGNVARALEDLKDAGYWIAALDAESPNTIYDLDTSGKLVIVVGSEGEGIRDIVRKHSDFVVAIPMRGKIESLNVSVAAAVAFFEIARRRSQPLATAAQAETVPHEN